EVNVLDRTDLRPDAGGTADFRPLVQQLLDEAAEAGGGRVVIPSPEGAAEPVTYRLRGPLHVGSRTELRLGRNVRLFFEYHPESYLPGGEPVLTRYEGTMIYTHSPLIRAVGASDVVIRGEAGDGPLPIIDGDGEKWMNACFEGQDAAEARGDEPTYQMLKRINNEGMPVAERVFTDPNNGLLRPTMISPLCCDRVLVEDVALHQGPFWMVHPVWSTNLTFRRIRFNAHVINNDGIDPESCRDVLIEDVEFDNADDNVAVKAGRDREGREGFDPRGTELEGVDSPFNQGGRLLGPNENVVMRGCVLKGHHAICIGSEMSSGSRNFFALDNVCHESVKLAVYLKGSRLRGGWIEDTYVEGLKIRNAIRGAICLNANYDVAPEAKFPPKFRHTVIRDVEIEHAATGIRVHGWSDAACEDVLIENVRIASCDADPLDVQQAENVVLRNVEIADESYDGEYEHHSEEDRVPQII
ncbi:MAG: glycoside hydrolase family 28 protein, partial [Phycisphaeraceae bacterium]